MRLRLATVLLLLAAPAQAKELVRTDGGFVWDGSGFYKSLLSGLVLQPDAVRGARALTSLIDDVAGTQTAAIPDGGAIGAHVLRLGSKIRYKDKLEFEVAWQTALSLASDPVFGGTSTLGSTIGGTGAGAQRRVYEWAGVIAKSGTATFDHNLDRLLVKFPLPFGDVTIGRQALSWGTGRLWNPTDVLSPFPPTAIDREIRRGFDAVRLAIALGEVSQLDVLYLPQLKPAEMGGVVRLQHNVNGWDWSASLGKYVRDLVLGADLVGDIGPVGVHAEAAYTLELAGLGTGPVTIGDHFFRGVLGAEVKPRDKLILMAEYAFNGYGTIDPARYATVLSSARVTRGEIFGAGQHQLALAGSFQATDLLTTQLSILANVTDPSAMIIPSVEYSLTQTVLLRGGAYLPVGLGPDPKVFTRLEATDVLTNSAALQAATTSRGLRSEYGSSSYGAFVQVGVYVP